MGNALKFTSRGYVEFDLRATESRQPGFSDICFYVRDSGIGISPSDQARLFEPFNQLDASTARRFGGTGLGLSIVKRLAELMGGSVRVESEVGAGTIFHVTLPCQLVREDYDPRKTMLIQLDITPDFAKARPLRILVAEDNLVNRKLARLLLQKFGYNPDEAEDGSRAVAMALENGYDLVLMDIQMPGMDGYEAAHRIREMCACPPRIVALTAHALKSDEERSQKLGMDGHLSKPIRADLLRKVLEKASRASSQKQPSKP
ncbi:MAG: ATP-binding protein [Chthoniobacterales bacterium]